MISINVYGIPQPAGSKKIITARGGPRKGLPVIIDDASNSSRAWKKNVRGEAEAAMDGVEPIEGPIELVLVFVMPRPKSHYGTGRNAETLKTAAPTRPITRPDTLKLARCIEDVLTGIVYRDDAQIVHEILSKRYGDAPGVQIFVAPYVDEESSQLRIEEVRA